MASSFVSLKCSSLPNSLVSITGCRITLRSISLLQKMPVVQMLNQTEATGWRDLSNKVTMNICRNCGSRSVRDLGFIGQIAPFFLKRVFNLRVELDAAGNPIKRWLRKTRFLPHSFFRKLYRTAALTELQACTQCQFVQTKEPFSDVGLARLYVDYRSDTYNTERTSFEPDYRQIAEDVGRSSQETETRVATLTAWLEQKIDFGDDFSMLDYGGADGRFLPRLAAQKYVYEISETRPLEGITRIAGEEKLTSYSYVQLAHILEHVSNPLAMVRALVPTIKSGGYLFIEVPQDLDDQKLARLIDGNADGCCSNS